MLRGQVVAADTGTPIRRAQVRVSAQNVREARITITDGQGRFEIRDLAAGRYTLTASKGGFVTLQYGQRRPGESGTPLELADGQALDKLMIALPRGSVMGGRITDEFGEPVVNAAVTAMRYAFVGGARRLVPAGARDTTDDQGSYRLFGLPPGDYLVSATLRAGGSHRRERRPVRLCPDLLSRDVEPRRGPTRARWRCRGERECLVRSHRHAAGSHQRSGDQRDRRPAGGGNGDARRPRMGPATGRAIMQGGGGARIEPDGRVPHEQRRAWPLPSCRPARGRAASGEFARMELSVGAR